VDGFEGRVALVTGAGSASGIGFATARLLGRAGAAVAVASTTGRIHERASELRDAGVDAEGFIADLTDRTAAHAMVDAVLQRFGRIDVLVNNAGMVTPTTSGARSSASSPRSASSATSRSTSRRRSTSRARRCPA
jgi:3-oxoacyl-[acyl-carrier protein] reductase